MAIFGIDFPIQGVKKYDGVSTTIYEEKNGLSNNTVFSIFEDNKGVIWFGTADGITCYDGKNFTVIPIVSITGNTYYKKTIPDNYGSSYPTENFVLSTMQDNKGILWFGMKASLKTVAVKNRV
jgi:ligand-binding sensor domain-containing protein